MQISPRVLFQKWRFYYCKASSTSCFCWTLVQYFLLFHWLTDYCFCYFLWNIYFFSFFTFQSIYRYSWGEFHLLEDRSFFLFSYLVILGLNTSRSLSLIYQPMSISNAIYDRLILIFLCWHLNRVIALLLWFKVFRLKISKNIDKINGLVSFW